MTAENFVQWRRNNFYRFTRKFLQRMNRNEVIMLSSDDEGDFSQGFEKKTSILSKHESGNSSDILKLYLQKFSIITKASIVIHNNKQAVEIGKLPKVPERKPKVTNNPEVVHLEDYPENLTDNGEPQIVHQSKKSSNENEKDGSSIDVIEVDEIQDESNFEHENNKTDTDDNAINSTIDSPTGNEKLIKVTSNAISSYSKDDKVINRSQTKAPEDLIGESPDENLKCFTEFVELCGSLEEVPNDRARLTKKLMKQYGEADDQYIKSLEFRELIQKSRLKVNKNNLYLIAKEVTDELIYRKKIEVDGGNQSILEAEKCQRSTEKVKANDIKDNTDIKSRRQTKVINKVIEKLDKLGRKIQELEKKEVDLSDEEESSYIQLQRYRERFCQVYTKLCTYTNEITDADRVCGRKICFSESKYPAINKCIENWLNKTKRFPDFTDVMKLLESQSSALRLPSNKESIRQIAIEIFQKVGCMLQRRRNYDLWDSFCGFLDAGEDPAEKDPVLDQVLKRNFETRVKKEQEIFQHFAELQEKERLEPEEVPDEEANHSPEESGNDEDEKEIEDIENSMNKRLDLEIKKETEENGTSAQVNSEKNHEISSKESKNNYENCKSLKWRLENSTKNKNDGVNSEHLNLGTESDEVIRLDTEEEEETEKRKEETSGTEGKTSFEKFHLVSPSKRKLDTKDDVDILPPEKKANKGNEEEDLDIFEICDEISERKANEVYEVHYCQIFTYNIFAEEETRRSWGGSRKVFRDLTNVKRLTELNDRTKKSGLFASSFFHWGFCDFEKPSWKKRFKGSFRQFGSKGKKFALSQEDESGKRINSNSDGGKEIQNNTEKAEGKEEPENFLGDGSGGEEDNNGDENRKNGKKGNEVSENQHEEEEDDEEENETEEDNERETIDHSSPTEKTEKLLDSNEPLETATTQKDEEDKQHGTSTEMFDVSFENEQESGREEETERKSEIEKESDKTEDESNGVIEIEMEDKSSVAETAKDKETGEEGIEEPENYLSIQCLETEETEEKTTEPKPELKPELQISISDETQMSPNSKTKTSEHLREEEPSDRKGPSPSDTLISVTGSKTMGTFPAKERLVKRERKRNTTVETKRPTFKYPVPQFTPPCQGFLRKVTPTPSTSDEERVKRFLLHSPSSISITPPRKLSLSKPPSEAVLQALATLRNLKGISATIVRGGKPSKDEEDVVVIGGPQKRRTEQSQSNVTKHRRNDLPVISSIQSIDSTTPKIVTVQGNVSGFETSWPETSNGDAQCSSSSIRISNVWGSLPNNFLQSMGNESPGRSFRQKNPRCSNPVKKKNTKKTVEYVVLE